MSVWPCIIDDMERIKATRCYTMVYWTLWIAQHVSGIHILPNNPTNKDQSQITKTLKQCNLILHKSQIRHWTQKKTLSARPESTTEATQTWRPHKTGGQEQKCPLIQSGQKTQWYPTTTPTPGQSIHDRKLNQPSSQPD